MVATECREAFRRSRSRAIRGRARRALEFGRDGDAVAREATGTEPHENRPADEDDDRDVEKREPPTFRGHAAGEVEDPADHQGAEETAEVSEHRVHGQRGSAAVGLGAAGGARGERGRLEPDQQTVEQYERASQRVGPATDRKSTRLNSSHSQISYAVFC